MLTCSFYFYKKGLDMKYSILKKTPLAIAILATLNASPVLAETLETITVKSDFREADIRQSTSSISVVNDTEINKRSARGLDDLIGITPNVNASSGASNANYFQIRGIGERSQFTTPINPSVGVLVDEFDYSRMGAGATMFDVKQVEVLRGPQGTKFGSSALAGVINIKTNEATKNSKVKIEATGGSHNTKALGVAAGGTLIDDTLLGRIAVHKHTSDGYMENTHLNRKDTQNEDELTARLNLKFLVNDELNFDLKVLHLNIDNGYDAFNFKNGYETISDDPGHDRLKSNAVALTANYKITNKVNMKAVVTKANTDSEYGYDEDWTFEAYDAPNFAYVAFDNYKRKRENRSLELRFMSSENGRIFNNTTDWVAGVYHLGQDESLNRNYTSTYGGSISSYDYNTVNSSVYGQLDHHLNDKTVLTAGLRVEKFDADFSNSASFLEKTDEVLFGGKLGLSYQINPQHLSFINVSRGYKAGGVNADSSLPADKVSFDTETLWNLEAGLNSSMFNGDLQSRLNVFYAARKDQQVNSSTQNGSGPVTFTIYQDNAAEGDSYGLEHQLDWLISSKFKLLTSLGLLNSSFVDYTYVDPSNLSNSISKDGRQQAHAPSYQYSIGGEVYATDNLTLSANFEGKDSFYFSNSHDQKSKDSQLLNASAEYALENWTIILWARNLADNKYDTRGFYFGNDPKDGWAETLWTQKGEPRTFGLTVSYDY